jgi:hypothetical protein
MIFNIGNQSGGVINNVARDQIISGSQSGVGRVTLVEARNAADVLQSLLRSVDLPAPDREELDGNLVDVNRELAKSHPDQCKVAHRLTDIVHRIIDAGSLIGATKEIVGTLNTIAQWLGPAGSHLLGFSPAWRRSTHRRPRSYCAEKAPRTQRRSITCSMCG